LGNSGTIFTLCAKRKAARWEVTVSGHKFKIGQFGNYLGRQSASGVYQVTQLSPPEGEAFQYRIKNVNEPPERVAKEHELRRATFYRHIICRANACPSTMTHRLNCFWRRP
jgi:hypothetical protein